MRGWFQHSFPIVFIEVIILLLAYFYFASISVPYFGALLFYFSGYYFSTPKNWLSVSLRFVSTIIIFFIVVFIDVVRHAASWEEIRFLGFGLAFLIFLIAFAIGWLLKNTIRNYDVKTLVFYSLLGILITRVAGFVSNPFLASTAGIIYFCFGLLLYSKSKLNKFVITAVLIFPFFLIYVGLSGLWELALAESLFVILSVFLSYLFVKYNH